MGHDFVSGDNTLGFLHLAIADDQQNYLLDLARVSSKRLGFKIRILRSYGAPDFSGASSSSQGPGIKFQSTSLQDRLGTVKLLDEAMTVICEAIISKITSNLIVSNADIDLEQPISACGVDSAVAVELRNWLLGQTGAEISAIDVLGPEISS